MAQLSKDSFVVGDPLITVRGAAELLLSRIALR